MCKIFSLGIYTDALGKSVSQLIMASILEAENLALQKWLVKPFFLIFLQF